MIFVNSFVIADVSDPGPDRSRRLGAVMAAYGLGFTVGPAIGSLFVASGHMNTNIVPPPVDRFSFCPNVGGALGNAFGHAGPVWLASILTGANLLGYKDESAQRRNCLFVDKKHNYKQCVLILERIVAAAQTSKSHNAGKVCKYRFLLCDVIIQFANKQQTPTCDGGAEVSLDAIPWSAAHSEVRLVNTIFNYVLLARNPALSFRFVNGFAFTCVVETAFGFFNKERLGLTARQSSYVVRRIRKFVRFVR
jgi:hypothetical protein